MRRYAETTRDIKGYATDYGSDIVSVLSSDGKRTYTVDITLGRCSCIGWTRHVNSDGSRNPCKHLRSLGFVKVVEAPELMEFNEPNKVTQHKEKVLHVA